MIAPGVGKPIQYPALYAVSACAARDAQATHFLLLRVQLAVFAVASAGGAVIGALADHRAVPVIVACVLAAGLLLMWIMSAGSYDRRWFASRAIAESVKGAAWEYMMQVPPYDEGAGGREVEGRFLETLHQIRRARPEEAALLSLPNGASDEISASMTTIRRSPWQERRQLYLVERLEDQRRWYENCGAANHRAASRWSWGVGVTQALGLVAAAIHAAGVLWGDSVLTTLMTLDGTFVAWTQAKRHDELAASYAHAARELMLLGSAATVHASDPAAFKRWVAEVEDVLSREHGLWYARRRVDADFHDARRTGVEAE